MEINNGINIKNISLFNNSKEIPIMEIVEFECFSFKDFSEINDKEGCLKRLNDSHDFGGVVFLFKAKKNLDLLNKKFYISGFKVYIFKDNGKISIPKQFTKKDFPNMMDNSTTQRVIDNDDLIQFGFVWFFDKPNDFKNANKMFIETYFAIDNIHKSYIVNKEINTFINDKFISNNMNILTEDKNVYGYCI